MKELIGEHLEQIVLEEKCIVLKLCIYIYEMEWGGIKTQNWRNIYLILFCTVIIITSE